MKITFSIINCNRLFYLKSCLESLLYCTEDFKDKEILLIDNASIEEGTDEYLLKKEKQGIRVFKNNERDPSNEYAKALNLTVREAKGDIICPLQGDMQFVVHGTWLEKYANLFKTVNNIGSVLLDAQRNIRNKESIPYYIPVNSYSNKEYRFLFDLKRNPINCAGDVMYDKELLKALGPWSENNFSHEGGNDSETNMLDRAKTFIKENSLELKCVVPIIPPAIGIFTDSRGTNARVRNNKRYGSYWCSKEEYKYYSIYEYEEALNKFSDKNIPIGIEDIARPIGFEKPLDKNGNWLKNPINPLLASPNDYVVLEDISKLEKEIKFNNNDEEYLKEWMAEQK